MPDLASDRQPLIYWADLRTVQDLKILMPQLKWDWKNDFLQQLNGNLADDSLNLMLESYDAINLSNNEVSKKYPNGRQIIRMAIN